MSPWSLFMRYVTRAGYLPQNIPLEMIRYLSEEKDFLPWHAASRALYPLDKLLDRMENYNVFNEYILKQVATTYLKLGWPKNNFNGSLVQASYQHEELRREVIMLACSFGNKHCHQQASTLISDWISSNRNRENNGGMEQYQTEFDKVLVFAAANVVRVRYNPSPSESAINTKGQRRNGEYESESTKIHDLA
ncbi:thyrotropin-releasing hormone-degrading ectoenzyme-like isoform X1 [Tenrec ecaudatus]|uniref:thyrotropin-releasing hormone-degrading ectoenzyme-like isoform X1 n=1 Tax=Tenrec ecaudatus TaxID=94439 RepID=UPI003F5A9B43